MIAALIEKLRRMEETLEKLKPAQSSGMLTDQTPRGVVRRPLPREAKDGGDHDRYCYWG
jgi:hypothetical protein